MGVTITQGTQTTINTVINNGTHTQVVKLDMGAGSASSMFSGTIPEITNIVGGTVNRGTVLPIGIRHADEFATVISTGTSDMGTVRGSVAGSQIFVTSLVVSVGSASNVVLASGGTSTPIGGTWFFNANGGLSAQFDPPLRTAIGSALVFKQSAAISPLTLTVSGYID
jgi:hypothetical protein